MIASDDDRGEDLNALRDELEAVRQEVAAIGALLAQALFDEAQAAVADADRLSAP